MCIKHDIHKYILAESKHLIPISYKMLPRERVSDQSTILNASQTSTHPEELRDSHQLLGYKVLADVIEALTGKYYEKENLAGAQKFLYALGIFSYSDYNYKLENNFPEELSKLKYLEKLNLKVYEILDKKYYFKNSAILFQVFNHRSITKHFIINSNKVSDSLKKFMEENNETDEKMPKNLDIEEMGKILRQNALQKAEIQANLTYERLEFLGDAILDYYILLFLYFNFPKAKTADSGILVYFFYF